MRTDDDDDSVHRRPWLLPALLGGIVLAVGAVWLASRAGTSSSGTGDSLRDAAATTADTRARDCIAAALAESDRLFDLAREASAVDTRRALVNLDGNGAFVDYAGNLAAIDLSSCPSDFRVAFGTWVGVWDDYGRAFRENTRFLGSRMSDADRVSLEHRINGAYEVMVTIAARWDINIPKYSYSL